MEPTIKSEPCEELYSAQDNDLQISTEINANLHPQNKLKRLHEEIDDNTLLSRNYSRHHSNNTSHETFEFPNAPQQHDSFSTNESILTMETEGKHLKKFRRMEANMLFNPPFFNLVEELFCRITGSTAARCYSCGKVVKGNRGISSNFIKHMKRSHPETYILYEELKSQKTKTFCLPNHPEMGSRKPTACIENGASGSDSTAATSNDDTNQCFETRTVTDNTMLNDSSDENDNSVDAMTEVVATSAPLEISAQTLKTLGKIIDEKLKTCFKQKDYECLKEKVNALTNLDKVNSVGHNLALAEFKTELDNLKKECSELRLAVQKSQASKRLLQNELQTVDKLLHQRKLIIRNIAVCDPENPLNSVETLFKDVMCLEDIKIAHCCVIPSSKTSKASNRETVSIELSRPQDCKAILRQTQKLKSTGIFIEPEISPFQRKRKNKLMVLRKELLRRKPELKVLVRDTTLVVNGKNFYWDDVEGLCHDGRSEAIKLNGVDYLKTVSGLDLKEFVIFLLNYNVQTT